MNLNPQLDQLENAQLVRRLEEAESAYLFRHTLTQERAYQSLLVKTRRNLHASVARACEELYAERLDEFAALLAHHYAEAGDDAKTLEYASRAGDVAARVYATAEAIAFYTQAIETAKRLGATSLHELYLKRGRLFETSGRYDQALANYVEMETFARAQSNRPLELAALIARATIHSIPSTLHNVPQSQALSDQALALAREIGDEAAEAKILWNLMLLYSRADTRDEEALRYGEQSLEIARRLGLREQLAYTLNDLSPLYVFVGQPERALQSGAEARVYWQETNNIPMLTDNFGYEAMNHVALGNFDEAIMASQEARRISQMIGNQWGEAFSLAWIGEAYFEVGRIDQAIAAMQTAIPLGRVFPPNLVIARADLAQIYCDIGAVERAVELAHLALAKADEIFPAFHAWAAASVLRVYIAQGDLGAAEELDRRERTNLEEIIPLNDSPLLIAKCQLALVQKDYDRVIEISEKLITRHATLRLRRHLPAAWLVKGQALFGLGKLDESHATLSEAKAQTQAMHARWGLWQLLAASSQVELARGNTADATRLRGAARALVEAIAADTPPDLRAAFLSTSLAKLPPA